MMRREGTLPVETPGGTFYLGLTRSNEHELDVYAETESGEVTINGVAYRATAYYRSRAYTLASGSVTRTDSHYWDTSYMHREWPDGEYRGLVPPSDAARRKLASWLTDAAVAMLADTDRTTAHQIKSAVSSREYALADANRDIDKANTYAAQIRALGGQCEDVPRFEIPR